MRQVYFQYQFHELCKLIPCHVKEYVKIDGSLKRKLELSQTSFFLHTRSASLISLLPSLLLLSETFGSKRVNLGAQINTIYTFLSHPQSENVITGIVHLRPYVVLPFEGR